MGVPIRASRRIGSSMRLPVPEKLNTSLGYEKPEGDTISFWNYNDSFELPLLCDQPLFSISGFSYAAESKYLGERKGNGDWDIRPKEELVSQVTSDFENDDKVFFLYRDEWLEGSPKFAYIMTNSDLPKNLPRAKSVIEDYSKLFEKNSRFDRRRLDEGRQDFNLQTSSLIDLLTNSGITDINSLINQVYTLNNVDRIDTKLDLPTP